MARARDLPLFVTERLRATALSHKPLRAREAVRESIVLPLFSLSVISVAAYARAVSHVSKHRRKWPDFGGRVMTLPHTYYDLFALLLVFVLLLNI